MRLLEIRTDANDAEGIASLSERLAVLLSQENCGDVYYIYCDQKEGKSYHLGSLDGFANIVSQSIESSFNLEVDYSQCIAVKSKVGCILIVFEDDGLIRIVVGHESFDRFFRDLAIFPIDDRSDLIVESDLMDDY